MKKTNKIGVLICMMLLITLALTGCELKKDDSQKTELNKVEVEGYTDYIHSSGIKFSYPTEWKNLGTTSNPIFGDTSTGTSVYYASNKPDKLNTLYSLESYVSDYIETIKENAEGDMEITGDVEKNEVRLNGRDAYIIKYTVVQASSNIIVKQAIFLDEGTAHILTVLTFENNYEDEVETMDNILKSFIK